MSRYARAVDENHGAIVRALRSVGATVQSIASVGQGTPDLLVGFRRQTYLLEVKDGSKSPSRRALTDLEGTWHAEWKGLPVLIVENVEDALRAIGVKR